MQNLEDLLANGTRCTCNRYHRTSRHLLIPSHSKSFLK